MKKTTPQNPTVARAEAKRLNALGYLTIRWQSHIARKVRCEQVRGLVFGYALDSQGRDCYLIRCTNPKDDGRFITRSVPVDQITLIVDAKGDSILPQ